MIPKANGRLLLLDDDAATRRALRRGLAEHGWQIECADNLDTALALTEAKRPARAIVSIELRRESGLAAIPALCKRHPRMPIVALTRCPSIAAGVEAIRRGARHYLVKPAGANDVLAAFRQSGGNIAVPIPDQPMSLAQVEWEHLQRILLQHRGNISAAARHLGMHRRTLQRKLQRLAPG